MNKKFKIFGLIVSLVNIAYIIWLFSNVSGTLGYLFYAAELMMISLSVLFTFNHWSQHHVKEVHKKPQGTLDVFLPVFNEDLDLFEKTVAAAKAIDYPKKVYILDDGPRAEMKALAKKLGVEYIENEDKNFKKSGNLNHALSKTSGDFILAIDADQIVKPEIAKDLLGYFSDDEKLAVLSTRQKFDVPASDFNHDHLFYDHMQAGKNADNAAISTGSAVFYRRSALKTIGHFQTWSVIEDMYTTFVFHKHGYRSRYINKAYSTGTAPQDLYSIYKQRGRWCHDSMRLFFFRPPLFAKGLTLKQRLHYFEFAWIYIVSAVGVPIIFSIPALNLILQDEIILDPVGYVLFRIPSFILILFYFFFLSRRNIRITQYWAGLFPVYLYSMFKAFLPIRKRYSVTPKTYGPGKRDIVLVLPQLLMVVASIAVLIWRIIEDQTITPETAVNGFWIVIMISWFYPIILKGFKKE